MEQCGNEAGRKTASDSGMSLFGSLGLHLDVNCYLLNQERPLLVKGMVEGPLGLQALFSQWRCDGRCVWVLSSFSRQ